MNRYSFNSYDFWKLLGVFFLKIMLKMDYQLLHFQNLSFDYAKDHVEWHTVRTNALSSIKADQLVEHMHLKADSRW